MNMQAGLPAYVCVEGALGSPYTGRVYPQMHTVQSSTVHGPPDSVRIDGATAMVYATWWWDGAGGR